MKILIADDNSVNRKLLRVTLEAEGNEVLEAINGVEALAILNKEKVDAIVSDILMPKMDGYRLCSEVRRAPEYNAIPFLVHTSTYLSPADEKLSRELGADAFLKKPSSAKTILEEIQKAKSPDYERKPVQRSETPVMTEYNEALVRKLEKKNAELEQSRIQLQEMNESLITSEQRYRTLFEENPLPMWVYDVETLQFLDVNAAAIRHYGYSKHEFLNMRLRDIRPPATIEHLMEYHGSSTNLLPGENLTNAGIWKHCKKDGTVIDVEVSWSNLIFEGKQAQLALLNDVTERTKAEEHEHLTRKALEEAEENYRSIFDNAPAGIFQTTPDGRYLTANPMEAYILGYDSPESLMKGISNVETEIFVHPELREELQKRLLESDVIRGFEFEAYRKDGQKIWVSEDLRVIRDSQGKVLRYEGFSQDITGRKSAIEQKEQLEKQLLQAQKIEAIGQLAGGVAHDYNNTLMAIGGYAELVLMQMREDDPLRKMLMEIQKCVAQGGDLTRQLLAFSRKQVLLPQILDLNQSIRKIEDMLQRLLGEVINFHATLAGNLGLIKADGGQINQIIVNLAVNARDAMPHGGMLTIETTNVMLEEEYSKTHADVKRGPYVCLSVSDTGIGMDEATISRIFEPFFTTKEEGKGTGLGLSTVYGIVKQSGGHISVYSHIGRGTSFKVYFPRMDETNKEETNPQSSLELEGKGEKILIVDDSEAIRSALGMILELKGYRVLVQRSGSEALETVRDTKEPIDLLISDVVMPEMGGQELAQKLRLQYPNLKVLYMSGYSDEAIRRQGELEPRAFFLSKPANSEKVLKKIREILG